MKSIKISDDVWETLMNIKLSEKKKSVDGVIIDLLKLRKKK